MKTKITPEVSNFILDNYFKMSQTKIAEHFGISKDTIRRFFVKNKIVVSKELRQQWKYENSLKAYKDFENQYIIKNIETKTIKQIASDLGRSTATLQKQVHILGLTEIIETKKQKSFFKKGHQPANKGKKIEEFMSAEAIEKLKPFQFKKNQIPHNALPNGAEVLRKDKSGRIYTLVKVPGERLLQLKQRVVWEAYHKKKIPAKHKIIFIDRNTSNFEINNLKCVSSAELMEMNNIHRYPEELKRAIRKLGKIKKQLNQKNNE
jgi:HNH endonuclease